VDVAERFDRRHEQLYGFRLPGHTHEVLAVRVRAVGPTPDAESLVPSREVAEHSAGGVEPWALRPVWDDSTGSYAEGAIYRWDDLARDIELSGPAVIEGLDSTVWVPGGATASIDAFGNVLVDLA
jgi:N-methylhydantoinase A